MPASRPLPPPASTPTSERAHLLCEECGDLAIHDVQYAGRLVVSSVCTSCGAVTSADTTDARTRYLRDLEHRLQSKPRRLLRRALDDPKGFVATLPTKVVAQPTKLAREWRTLFGAPRARGTRRTPPAK